MSDLPRPSAYVDAKPSSSTLSSTASGVTAGGGGGQPLLLHLVRDVRQGRVAAACLSSADRRACVEYFTGEGMTAPEIAVVMNVSDRTVRRDRQAIRRANTLRPGKELADEVVGELCSRAESAISRLHRAVRDTGDGPVTPHMRMRAEIAAFRIYRDLVIVLSKLEYIPTGKEQLNAEYVAKIRGADPWPACSRAERLRRNIASTGRSNEVVVAAGRTNAAGPPRMLSKARTLSGQGRSHLTLVRWTTPTEAVT